MERLKRYWDAFKDIAIVFSFTVNFVMVVLLFSLGGPAIRSAFALKTGMVEPLLDNLDAAFVDLGASEVDTQIEIAESVPIEFVLDINEQLPIDFQLSIEQNTVVVLSEPVPLTGLPAKFTLPGGGGVINGHVTLSLPAGQRLPTHLSLVVPVSKTIPVRMAVPVNQTIPIRMTVPVNIALGQAGLAPAVDSLREVFRPLREQVEGLPDGIELR